MELLTPELRQRIPPIGSTSDQGDPMVRAKFFHPAFAWYVIEASVALPGGKQVALSDPAAAAVGLAEADLRPEAWNPGETPPEADLRAGDIEFFGLVCFRDRPEDAELGTFWLWQLRGLAFAAPYVAVERDRYTFTPAPLSEVKQHINA